MHDVLQDGKKKSKPKLSHVLKKQIRTRALPDSVIETIDQDRLAEDEEDFMQTDRK